MTVSIIAVGLSANGEDCAGHEADDASAHRHAERHDERV
jgi:hypothetical protein